MTRFAFLTLALVGACSQAPAVAGLPQGYPLESEVAEVSDELELHRANINQADAMDELRAELVRHRTVSFPRYVELRTGLVQMDTCMAAEARAQMTSLMNGIEATEKGRDEALLRARGIADARDIADRYAAGVGELVGRMIGVSAQQTSCYKAAQ